MVKENLVHKPITKVPQKSKNPFISASENKKGLGIKTNLKELNTKTALKEKELIKPEDLKTQKKNIAKQILEKQKAEIQKVAAEQKEHDSPEQKVAETQKSVAVSPALQQSSKAKSDQVEVMANQKTKKFDAKKFSDDILKNIKKVIPKNKEEMDKDVTSSEKMDTAKENINSTLTAEKNNSGGALEGAVSTIPDTSSVAIKEAETLPEENIGNNPEIANAGIKPPVKDPSETDLSEDSKKIDDEMVNNKVTQSQLENGNEVSFNQSLDEKKQSQDNASETHNQYLQASTPIANAAKNETASAVNSGLTKMGSKRSANLKALDASKQEKKQKEEVIRAKVAKDLNDIYDNTQKKVDTILKDLDTKVNFTFDTALSLANKTFEKNVRDRTSTSFWDDPLLWAADLVVGLPRDMEKIFREEQDNFINFLKPVVLKIGEFVEQELTNATKEIENGKIKTKEYWDSQDKDTKKIAGDIYTSATAKFTELETKVEEANENLKSTITTKFNEAVAKLEETFEKIKEENKSWLQKAYDAVVGVIQAIIEMKNLLFTVLAKVADTIADIILDPIGFLSNLLDAIMLGFKNFGLNALEHLKKGFFAWLMGNMPPSIKFPKKWDLAGIFEFVLSILGLTWDNIKARATKIFGATVVSVLETSFEIFQIIIKEGLGGLWRFIKEKIGDLKVMVIDAIQNMLIESVIKAGITWVISLFNPAGAFIKACKLIYDVISWFINNAKRILDLINSIVDSTALIVQGKIGKAAQFVENSLAKMIPIAIGFLAGLLGLGDLSKKVQALIDKIQAPINKAIDWVLEKAKSFALKLINAGKAGVNKLLSWLGLKKEFKAKDDKNHTINIEGNEKKPKIIIRSSPKTLEELIADFKKENEYINNKSKYNPKIEAAISIKNKFENAMEKNQGKNGVDYNKQFEEMTLSLINYIKDLFISPKPTDKRKVSFTGVANGVSLGMSANPLVNDGTTGASTTAAKGAYEPLFKRKHHGGNVPYYIQGHLLNHHLGGPNEDSNLTPLKRSTNSEHEKIIEKSLKVHYNENKKLKYIVTPNYGIATPLINNATTTKEKTINEIKEQEEKSVPVSISIQSSFFIEDDTGKEIEKPIFNGTLNNNIETDSKDYTV